MPESGVLFLATSPPVLVGCLVQTKPYVFASARAFHTQSDQYDDRISARFIGRDFVVLRIMPKCAHIRECS